MSKIIGFPQQIGNEYRSGFLILLLIGLYATSLLGLGGCGKSDTTATSGSAVATTATKGAGKSSTTTISTSVSSALSKAGMSQANADAVAAELSKGTKAALTGTRGAYRGKFRSSDPVLQANHDFQLLTTVPIDDTLPANYSKVAAQMMALIPVIVKDPDLASLNLAADPALPTYLGAAVGAVIKTFGASGDADMKAAIKTDIQGFINSNCATVAANINSEGMTPQMFDASVKNMMKNMLGNLGDVGVSETDMKAAAKACMGEVGKNLGNNDNLSKAQVQSQLKIAIAGASAGIGLNSGVANGGSAMLTDIANGAVDGVAIAGDVSFSSTEMQKLATDAVSEAVKNLDLNSIKDILVSAGLKTDAAEAQIKTLRESIMSTINTAMAGLCEEKGWVANADTFKGTLDNVTTAIQVAYVTQPYGWIDGGSFQEKSNINISGYGQAASKINLYSDFECKTLVSGSTEQTADDYGNFTFSNIAVSATVPSNFYLRASATDTVANKVEYSPCSTSIFFTYANQYAVASAAPAASVNADGSLNAPVITGISGWYDSNWVYTEGVPTSDNARQIVISGTSAPYSSLEIFTNSTCLGYGTYAYTNHDGTFDAYVSTQPGNTSYYAMAKSYDYTASSTCSTTSVSYNYNYSVPSLSGLSVFWYSIASYTSTSASPSPTPYSSPYPNSSASPSASPSSTYTPYAPGTTESVVHTSVPTNSSVVSYIIYSVTLSSSLNGYVQFYGSADCGVVGGDYAIAYGYQDYNSSTINAYNGYHYPSSSTPIPTNKFSMKVSDYYSGTTENCTDLSTQYNNLVRE